MAFAPVITRIYGPENIGIQGVFLNIVGVFGSVAALTYPMAIALPRKESDAIALVKISVIAGIIFAILMSVLLLIAGNEFLAQINMEKISPYKYLLPISMLFLVFSAVAGQWMVRRKKFILTSKVTAWQTLIISIIKSSLGLLYPTVIVLIIASIIGNIITVLMLMSGFRNNKTTKLLEKIITITPRNLVKVGNEYIDFPLLRAPQVFLNSVSHSLPVIMLAAQFGPASAGYYTIALTVLTIPVGLVGGSVMQVFYPRINEAYLKGKNVQELLTKATKGLILIGVGPFIAVILFGPYLFEVVFGGDWKIAGDYARWLSLFIFMFYINRPAVAAIPILKLQGGLLAYEVVSTSSKLLALYVGSLYFASDVATIALFSGVGVLTYAWLILWVIRQSGKIGNTRKIHS